MMVYSEYEGFTPVTDYTPKLMSYQTAVISSGANTGIEAV